jgi:hypothetical protein
MPGFWFCRFCCCSCFCFTRLRKGPFEGPATVKPPALPEDSYCPESLIRLQYRATESHIAFALGLAACQEGYRVRFTTAAAMVHELIEAKGEKWLLRYQKQMAAYELLIVDELGFVPLSKTEVQPW